MYIWALGLFAAGQAATMVCTYSGYVHSLINLIDISLRLSEHLGLSMYG